MKGNPIYRFVFAGGGTGGHLYPAIAVAEKIKEIKPESEILFMGTKSKIEARVVPQCGFRFKSIWISGFSRKMTISNILFPLKVIVSYFQSLFTVMNFKPRVAIGAGAYVAGPVIAAASAMGSKIILLEQNSYPGITNRLLERKANEIHITYEDSKKYFRFEDRMKLTGNPVRPNLKLISREEACSRLNLSSSRKVLLILGGSGGARSINEAVADNLKFFNQENIQLLWQCGNYYLDKYKIFESEFVKVTAFIDDVALAYSAADLIIARAGATTIAEISNLGLASILVPSPNVAANHQFHNAESLRKSDAVEMIEDDKLGEALVEKVNSIIFDRDKLDLLKRNVRKFSRPNAAGDVAESAIKLAESV